MNCSKCGEKTRVIDCASDGYYVYRRRKCNKCGYTMATEEMEACDKNLILKKIAETKQRNLQNKK